MIYLDLDSSHAGAIVFWELLRPGLLQGYAAKALHPTIREINNPWPRHPAGAPPNRPWKVEP